MPEPGDDSNDMTSVRYYGANAIHALRAGIGLPPAGRCQTKRRSPPTEAALLPGFELCDPAIQLPQLNVVTVNELFGAFFRCVVVRAMKVHGA
jgi:hypothetical protein